MWINIYMGAMLMYMNYEPILLAVAVTYLIVQTWRGRNK